MARKTTTINESEDFNISPEAQIATDLAREEATQPDVKWHIFKLVDNSKNGKLHIDGRDDVLNPKTNKMDRIWLVTGWPSIWQSELQEEIKDKDYIRNNIRSLQFQFKTLRIADYDTTALEFARNCRHFIENKNRKTGSKFEFFEWNPKKQQEAALAKEKLEIEMMLKAQASPVEEMRKHAHFLGIRFVDEMGEPKTEDGIRLDYITYAKRNPDTFKKSLGTKEVDVAYAVKKAIISAKIDIGGGSGRITWAQTGGMICIMPRGREAQEYLIELALTNSDEGRTFLDQLNAYIK